MDYQHYFETASDWEQRPIWICGLDVVSLGVIRFLEQKGHPAEGILDDGFSTLVHIGGVDIWPAEHLAEIPDGALFVVAAFREKKQREFQNQITERFGAKSLLNLSNAIEIRVEVSGLCNLRCPSCQVANHGDANFRYSERGFMEPRQLDRILCKIDREIPQAPAIYLFSLGEPLLNKRLPELIRQVHAHRYPAVISSNLSLRADLAELVASGPDIFKISVSGFTPEVYQTTHVGGNVELVKENMQTLSALIQKQNKRIFVTVGYHIYSNNSGPELDSMRRFCEELGFLFQPVEALYFNMMKRSGHFLFSESDRQFIERYYLHPEKIIAGSAPEPITDERKICRNMRDKLFLDYDGTVMLCEIFHHSGFYKSYLDVSLDEIQKWRQEHWICRRCMEYGMHLKA